MVIICRQPRPDSTTTENFFESNPYFELKDESLEISLGKFFSNQFPSPAKCTICTEGKEKVYGGDIDIHSGYLHRSDTNQMGERCIAS